MRYNTLMNVWSDISVFLAVMRHGSAAAAARTLGTNQTTVSRRIARLEDRLGLKLFAPGPRGAQPTEAARRLFPDAEALEDAGETFLRHADDITRRLSGTIRLTAHPAAVRYAAGLLLQFEREHPDTKIVVDAETRTLSLEDGEADIALRPGRRLTGDTLVARKLFDHPWGFFASESYIQRKGRPAGFGEMSGHRVVRNSGPFSHVDPIPDAHARLPDGAETIETETIHEAIGLAAAGEALVFLPRAEGDVDPALSFCFTDPDLFQSHWLVTTDVGHADPLIRGFFKFCAQAVPTLMASLPSEWRV